MKTCILFLIPLLFFLHVTGVGQVKVNDKKNTIDLVKSLEGPGVKISNIKYHALYKRFNPMGYFTDKSKQIGIAEGVLLTTGAAIYAEGPNNSSGKGEVNNDYTQDADLNAIVGNVNIFDLCFIEFDFQASADVLSFNFVFASEEYIEYLGYNDILAFIITGPDIPNRKNLALIPGTNIPVSVSNINPGSYSQFYIDNNDQHPSFNTQYDGFTKSFTASTKVTPCVTYHIKIAIADAKDGMLDSGVFLEKGSFRSENPPTYKVEYQYPKFNYGIEGCNNARVVFYRNALVNDSINLSYTFKIGGTAIQGKDYDSINNTIHLLAGTDSTSVEFNFIKDTITEDNETIVLSLQSTCPNFPDIQTVTLSINDKFPYHIPDDKVCAQGSVMLNKAADKSTNIEWAFTNQLTCLNCLSPTAKPDSSQYFKYTITDTASHCASYDSVRIEVVRVNADFSFGFQSCYSSLDLFFVNKSYNAKRYYWDFGDNSNSEDQDPAHHYQHNNKKEAISYNVTLTAKSNHPQCSAEVTKTITISKPLFIPNLITPNGDRMNDALEIQGISDECWTLTIFNRWGSIVYQKVNYQNNFEGTNLEEGTYYYQLENGNKDREYKGWLQLIANTLNE